MQWIEQFDLFLFDFDGLLVNTEELHFKAYQEMCRRYGFDLSWTINQFFEAAHFDSAGLKTAIYTRFPDLLKKEPRWEVLYAEKKKIYEELLQKGTLTLMPGVEDVLKKLAFQNKKRCVVTNSARVQIELIKMQINVLNTIPHWFTREDYKLAKPAPDGYLTALAELKTEGDRVIGFEDSSRGFQSLKEAGVANRVLICPLDHPQLRGDVAELKQSYASSFETISALFETSLL